MATTKRKAKRKTRKKFSPLLILTLVLIAIVLLSIGIGYYMTNKDKSVTNDEVKTEEVTAVPNSDETTTNKIVKTPLEGSWVSLYDGAILTFTGLDFILELPSVDSPEKITGKIALENTIVTFYYTSGKKSCLDVEGHYQFTIQEEEVNFKVIKDLCSSRKERMTANWFKL